MGRIIADKQIEQAAGPDHILISDNSNNYNHQEFVISLATDVDTTGAVAGSLLYFNGTNWINLAIGVNNQILTVAGGIPTWSNSAAVVAFDITDGTTTQTINNGDAITFANGDGGNAVVSATDTVTFSVRRITEEFSVTSATGSAVTIAGTLPSDANLIDVYRNGLLQREGGGNDFTIAGQIITFNEAFGGSTNGTDAEEIIVLYFEG